MNKNMMVAKELVKLAKSLVALDEKQEQLDLAEKEGKKYVLYERKGRLYRIRACKDFGDVKKGDLGGFIESEKNLSHKGNCWVYDEAKVWDDALVDENAKVYGNAMVYGRGVEVGGNAGVYGNAHVYGVAHVYGDAHVYGNAHVGAAFEGNISMSGPTVCGNAEVYENAWVYGDYETHGDTVVKGSAKIHGNAHVGYSVSEGDITE